MPPAPAAGPLLQYTRRVNELAGEHYLGLSLKVLQRQIKASLRVPPKVKMPLHI